MDPKPLDLGTSLKALGAEARRNLGPHLEPEQLLAYRAGELPEAAVESIRDHLALCPDCAQLFLDLIDFESSDEPSGSGETIPEEDVETAWEEARERLVREGRLAEAPQEVLVSPPRSVLIPFEAGRRTGDYAGTVQHLRLALAASLAACLALSVWVVTIRGSAPTGSVSRAGIQRVPHLLLQAQRGVEDPERFVLSPDQDFYLDIPIPETVGRSEFDMEISPQGQGGKPIKRARVVGTPGETETYRVGGSGFAAGIYQVRIFPLGQSESVAEYMFSIESRSMSNTTSGSDLRP